MSRRLLSNTEPNSYLVTACVAGVYAAVKPHLCLVPRSVCASSAHAFPNPLPLQLPFIFLVASSCCFVCVCVSCYKYLLSVGSTTIKMIYRFIKGNGMEWNKTSSEASSSTSCTALPGVGTIRRE
jgi:hypothetical protein